MLYISFNYRELHRLKEAVFAPHMVNAGLELVGIRVTVKQEEFRAVISRIMGSFDYQVGLMNLDFPVEPADHVSVLLSSGPMHMWNPRQASPATAWERRIDELMLAQRTTLDLSERRKLYQEVQPILAHWEPVVPLVNRKVLVASREEVKNLRPVSIFPYVLWNLWEIYKEGTL